MPSLYCTFFTRLYFILPHKIHCHIFFPSCKNTPPVMSHYTVHIPTTSLFFPFFFHSSAFSLAARPDRHNDFFFRTSRAPYCVRYLHMSTLSFVPHHGFTSLHHHPCHFLSSLCTCQCKPRRPCFTSVTKKLYILFTTYS